MGSFVQYTVQGLAAGGFYALAALGLAVIFGVLGVVNFSHGACYMLGAVGAAVLLDTTNLGFWPALLIVPVVMFVFGVLMERLLVRWLLRLDPLYNFLLTFGLTLLLVDLVKRRYGVSGLPYQLPAGLEGNVTIGELSLSAYQIFACLFSLAVCVIVWAVLT
ncbi:MAG: branched-chain amino acid ABC transporter permease, partial [Actinomycetota bacterium]